jgi:hypothetical protein
MSDLADLVESVKRTAAVPGAWAQTFPETTDADLIGLVMDAVAEAQLDGFMREYVIDDDLETVVPHASRPGGSLLPAGALIVLYAQVRLIDAELRNRKNRVNYQSKGNVFDEETSASLLVEIYRELKARKRDLLEQSRRAGEATAFFMADQAYFRALGEYDHSDPQLGHNWSALRALAGG